MFGGELYGQSLVQEFGKIFLSRDSGTEQTLRRDYRKELLELCSEMSEGDRENSEDKISQLSRCFSTLIAEECQHPEPELSGLLGDLSAQEAETVGRAVSRILSNSQFSSAFFSPPLLDLLLDILPVDFVPRRLVLLFDQAAIEADQAVASFLFLLASMAPRPPLPDGEAIIEKLEVSRYCSLRLLLRLEQERKPSLAPVPLEQITEDIRVVTEKVNILSNCSSLSASDIVRYALHIAAIEPDCGLQLLQNFVLELPLSCLLYFCLAVADCADSEGDQRELEDLQFLSLLARAASLHLPGWSEAWSRALHSHPLLAGTLTEALKVTNERRLSMAANIVGAHKAADCLELVSLADFLAWSHLGLSHRKYIKALLSLVKLLYDCALIGQTFI